MNGAAVVEDDTFDSSTTRRRGASSIATARVGSSSLRKRPLKLIVRQLSGLGNQMFQYAAGRYYARQLGAQVSLAFEPPHKALSYGHPRPFLLSHFAISAPFRELNRFERMLFHSEYIVTHSRRLMSLRPIIGKALYGSLERGLRIQLLAETVEQSYQFQAGLPFNEQADTIYLRGYWQVHQIPESIAADLRREFICRDAPSGKNSDMHRLIKNTANAVAIHVRRGDYTLEVEGNVALPMTYYSSAVSQLVQTLRNPTFFIFSDDIEFARENMRKDISAVFVDHNDSFSAHEDMRLMSACRHHIIANSTFSWWGAWLTPYFDSIVIAPRNWMGRRPHYNDLFPSNWRLLG